MSHIKIGILREGKIPIDTRVPMTPQQAAKTQELFPSIKVIVQKSPLRCFDDMEYVKHGIEIVDNVTDCDILLGVKEVQIIELVDDKTYFFFSHTIKEQPYNRALLKEILRKRIKLIDWECLTDLEGIRLIAFGRYAGIVGAYNSLWTFGERYNLFHLKRAFECDDLEDLKSEFRKIVLPAIKIAVTGGGRVAKGAMEVLNAVGVKRVSAREYLTRDFDVPVFAQLNSRDYNKPSNGAPFDRDEFHIHPESYVSDFHKFAVKTDLFIAAAYWDPNAPVLFRREQILQDDFKIRVIADITCDIEGSIPSTKRATSIENPVYDYDAGNDEIRNPFTDEANITVMAVDNLPCELPKDASNDFGKQLIEYILPPLLGDDADGIIRRAKITEQGKLAEPYLYLRDYVGQ